MDRKCSHCKKPVKGHKGQCGDKCMDSPLTDHEQYDGINAGDQPEGALSLPPPVQEVNKSINNTPDIMTLNTNIESLVRQNQQVLALLMKNMNLSQTQKDTDHLQVMGSTQGSEPQVSGSTPKALDSTSQVSHSASQAPNSSQQVPSSASQVTGNITQPPNHTLLALDLSPPSLSEPSAVVPPQNVHQTTQSYPTLHSGEAYYLHNGSKLSEPLRKSVLAGEYVNLAEFLTKSDTNDFEAHISDGEVQFKTKRCKRSLDNFYVWLQAWNEFEALLMSTYPHLYSNLASYRRLIQLLDHKYSWPAIYVYDQRFRAELARNNSFSYHIQNNDLMVTILDATAIKSDLKRCLRCKSTEHYVQECPFQSSKAEVQKTGSKHFTFFKDFFKCHI